MGQVQRNGSGTLFRDWVTNKQYVLFIIVGSILKTRLARSDPARIQKNVHSFQQFIFERFWNFHKNSHNSFARFSFYRKFDFFQKLNRNHAFLMKFFEKNSNFNRSPARKFFNPVWNYLLFQLSPRWPKNWYLSVLEPFNIWSRQTMMRWRTITSTTISSITGRRVVPSISIFFILSTKTNNSVPSRLVSSTGLPPEWRILRKSTNLFSLFFSIDLFLYKRSQLINTHFVLFTF